MCLNMCTCILMYIETQSWYLESFSMNFPYYLMKHGSSVKHGVQWLSYSCLQLRFAASLYLFSKSVIIGRPSSPSWINLDSEDLVLSPHTWMTSANSFVPLPGLHLESLKTINFTCKFGALNNDKQTLAKMEIWVSNIGFGC